MNWKAVSGMLLAIVLASIALSASIFSVPAKGAAFRNAQGHPVAGGCVRPTRSGGPHSAFYGVEAIAMRLTTESAIVAITPHNEAHRWCALSFVIDEATTPITVRVAFLKKSTSYDRTLVEAYLKTSGLFSRVWILPKGMWVPT